MSLSAIGTNIEFRFNMKFPTFTPDQYKQNLVERKFTLAQRSIQNPQNPQGPPIIVPIFSKGNMNVILGQNMQQIHFQIFNTINLTDVYKDIKDISVSLSIFDEIIQNAGFNCLSRTKAKNKPQSTLTELTNSNFLNSLEKCFGQKLDVVSLKLATIFPLGMEGLQVIIEPLATSPNDEYFLNIIYQTNDIKQFDNFIQRFGEKMIQEIADIIEKKC